MKDKNTTWHGIDASKEVSLLEYNLLVRWDRSKQSFQCIYKIGIDRWGIAFMANREIDQIIMEDWFDLDSFQSFVGIPIGSWISGDFVSKVHDLISFVGHENVFGMTYYPKSTKEVCKLSRVDYSPEYAYN